MNSKTYRDSKGSLYRIGEIGELGNADRTRLAVKMLSEKLDAKWRKMPMTPTWPITNEKDAAEALEIMAAEKGWQQTGKAEIQAEGDVEDQEITTFKELGLSDNCIRVLYDMGFDDDDVDILGSLLPSEEDRLQRDFPDNWERIRAFVKKDEHSADTDDAKEESSEAENPTYSSAATAAGAEAAENPEPVDSEHTTETAVSISEAAESADVIVPASTNTPAVFDYSGLDEQTVDVMHMAETEIQQARQGYIIRVSAAVAAVHEAVVGNSDNSKHGKRGDSTFTSWCDYVGIKRDAAYRFLQVDKLLNNATEQEAAQLEQASPSLLYAAAKPSAPAELVQAVKDGDITTHKAFKELEKQLAEERELRRQAEYGRDCAVKDLHQLERESAEDQQRLEGLLKNTDERLAATNEKAENFHRLLARRNEELQDERNERAALLDQQGEYIARIKELENRPIDVAVQQPDPEEIERRALKKAEAMTADLRREHEDRMNDQYDAAILALRTIENNRMIAKVSCSALPSEMRTDLTSKYREIINKMQEDMQCL